MVTQNEFYRLIGGFVQRLRGNESRSSFAKRAGVSFGTLVSCERGARIRFATLESLATAASVNVEEMINFAGEMARLRQERARLEAELIYKQRIIITLEYIKTHWLRGMA